MAYVSDKAIYPPDASFPLRSLSKAMLELASLLQEGDGFLQQMTTQQEALKAQLKNK